MNRLSLVLIACFAALGCGSNTADDPGEDLSEGTEVVDTDDGKADSSSKPLGVFAAEEPGLVGVGNPSLLELKSDGTYRAEILVECFKAPCDPIEQEGVFKYTKTKTKKYITLTAQPLGKDVKYAYSFKSPTLTLTAMPEGEPFELVKKSTTTTNSCVKAGGTCVGIYPDSCAPPSTIGDATEYSCGDTVGVQCCLPLLTPEAACLKAGGTVDTMMCCKSTADFPGSCGLGPCGCSLENSHNVSVCRCPAGKCFDGTTCVKEP